MLMRMPWVANKSTYSLAAYGTPCSEWCTKPGAGRRRRSAMRKASWVTLPAFDPKPSRM